MPTGGEVVSGQASFTTIGNTLTIQASPGTVINWQSFSIGANESVNFAQPSASSIVLNRVTGNDSSALLGTLTSNGQVSLVNSTGLLVGQNGRVDVAGFVVSTLDISNSNFSVVNLGTTLINTGILTSWNGATLVNNGALTLVRSTTTDTTGRLTGSYSIGIITPADVTSAGGNISVGNGIFLSTTTQNTVVATLGLGGPRLPTASTTSNPAAFSTWLNTNALVTHTQLDSIGTLIRSGLNSVLFGSHHRILRDNGMTNSGNGFWATGDFARHDPSNTNASIGEFGVYKDVTPTLRLGAGAGVNQARQGLPLSGSGKLDSTYLVVESDYQSLASDWGGSATVYLGSNHAGIARGYLVGITPNLSSGEANGSSWALRLRSDWSNIASVKGWGVSPYLAYTHAESRLDGYTEAGGTLPITFAAQKQISDELRGGVTLLSRLSEQTDLRFPLELAHRSNGSAVVTGVAAANSFSFSNAGSMQDWGRVGIELDHRLNKQTVLNGAALYASRGGDSSWLGTVGLKYAF